LVADTEVSVTVAVPITNAVQTKHTINPVTTNGDGTGGIIVVAQESTFSAVYIVTTAISGTVLQFRQ